PVQTSFLERSPVVMLSNDTGAPAISVLSLPDALPIYRQALAGRPAHWGFGSGRTHRRAAGRRLPAPAGPARSARAQPAAAHNWADRKSTRLNSRHVSISYAALCLKRNRISLVPVGGKR